MCPEGRATLAECASGLQVRVAGCLCSSREGIEQDEERKLQRALLRRLALLETLLEVGNPL